MREVTILKSQRAEIGKLLVTQGLRPKDFEWKVVDSTFAEKTTVQSLVHKETGFYFTLDVYKRVGKSETWVCPHSPDQNKLVANTLATDWKVVTTLFNSWAKLVKREQDAEDPWDESAEEFSSNWTTSGEGFTEPEIEKIDHSLDQIKAYLIEQSDKSEAATTAIESGIEDLKDSARKISKKDWLLLFAGWFFSQSASWAIGQEHWHHVLALLLKGTKTFLLQMP